MERLAEQTIYGEAQGDAANHRTRVYQVRDAAGIVTSVAYDFKGNLLESRRDLLPIAASTQGVDWQQNLIANDGSFTSANRVRRPQPPAHPHLAGRQRLPATPSTRPTCSTRST